MFELNKRYSFRTKAPLYLGGEYVGLRLVRTAIFEDVVGLANDILTIAEKVRLEITELPADARKLSYLVFKNIDNKSIVLAREWVDADSIVLLPDSASMRIDVIGVNITTKEMIVNWLKNNGLKFTWDVY